jgi:hypothetical protein
MIEISEITEQVVITVSRFSGDITFNIVLAESMKKIPNFNKFELDKQLTLLSNLGILKTDGYADSKIIIKLPKFNEVCEAGSIEKYRTKQKEQSELDKEIKGMQHQELSVRVKYVEKQYKDQRNYWITAVLISLLALLISVLSYLKK